MVSAKLATTFERGETVTSVCLLLGNLLSTFV